MKIIDVSGFGHSGKTAASDLFHEVQGVEAHDHCFEFGLLRLPDGILELEEALCGNWSPARSDRSVKRFYKLCKILSNSYCDHLSTSFLEDSEQYIKSLVEEKLLVNGWYDVLYDCTSPSLTKTILGKFKILNLARNLKNLLPKVEISTPNKSQVFLSGGNDFVPKTKNYLQKILCSNVKKQSTFVLTNNMLEPFFPSKGIRLFDDAFCIVVERDPRDIYASVIRFDESFVPDFEGKNKEFSKKYFKNLKSDFLGCDNINAFIRRQRIYHDKMDVSRDCDRIIRIKYEDLVLKYDDTVKKLFSQLGIDSSDHVMKKKFFDPNQSSKNVGLWKTLPDDDNIKKITNELEDLLYDIK